MFYFAIGLAAGFLLAYLTIGVLYLWLCIDARSSASEKD